MSGSLSCQGSAVFRGWCVKLLLEEDDGTLEDFKIIFISKECFNAEIGPSCLILLALLEDLNALEFLQEFGEQVFI